jgi:hypothetical protein
MCTSPLIPITQENDMYMASFVARYDYIRTLAFFEIAAGYTQLGAPCEHPIRLIKVKNLTDSDLLFTLNPPDAQFIVPSYTGEVIDVTSNTFNTTMSGIFAFPIGTTVYVKQVNYEVPSMGAVYVEIIYGSEQQ